MVVFVPTLRVTRTEVVCQSRASSLSARVPDDEDPTPMTVVCDLDKTPSSTVREIIRDLLSRRNELMVKDAVLVTDELVSNARQHGDAPRRCRVRLLESEGHLRVEVDDASPVHPRMRTPDGSGGRGLILVDRLSSRWGVEHYASHKTVWAELVLDGAGSSGHVPRIAGVRPTSS